MDAHGWFGPYRLIFELEPARIAPADAAVPSVRRWAAVHERDHSGHLVYSVGPVKDRFAKRRFLAAAERASTLRNPHVLAVEAYSFAEKLGACLVSPYPGHHSGVVTLADLLEHKGGRLSGPETTRATAHLLAGLAGAHREGVIDGALTMERVHVDPRGSLLLELPGFWRGMTRCAPASESELRADIAAVALMTHQMIAGVPALRGLPRLPRDADPRWRAWISHALDPVEGFATAKDAMHALPLPAATPAPEPKPSLMRSLLGKIKAALPLL
jgi:hypothetical protein